MSKVSFNLHQNAFGLWFAKAFYEPFFWFVIVLTLVAAIHTITQRDNVSGSRATPFTQRNPMVSGSRMEKAVQWSFTNGTAMMEVIQAILPIGFCEIIRQIQFTGAPAVVVNLDLMAIGLAIIMVISLYMLFVDFTPIPCFIKHTLFVSLAKFGGGPSGYFRVTFSSLSRMLSSLFRILMYPVQFPGIVAVFTFVLKTIHIAGFAIKMLSRRRFELFANVALFHAFSIVDGFKAHQFNRPVISCFGVCIPARFAATIEAVSRFFSSVEKFARGRKLVAAIRTTLHGGHEHTPSWPSLLGCGQAAKLAVRAGSYSALVHMGNYTMKAGV